MLATAIAFCSDVFPELMRVMDHQQGSPATGMSAVRVICLACGDGWMPGRYRKGDSHKKCEFAELNDPDETKVPRTSAVLMDAIMDSNRTSTAIWGEAWRPELSPPQAFVTV